MVSRRLMAMLASAAALAILAAGCGGEDNDGEGSLTKAEYVKQGSALCAKSLKKLGAELQAFSREADPKKKKTKAGGTEMIAEVILPSYRVQVEELQKLPPPSGDEEQVEAMLDALEQGIREGEENPGSFFEQAESKFVKGRQMAEKYGLEGCASLF